MCRRAHIPLFWKSQKPRATAVDRGRSSLNTALEPSTGALQAPQWLEPTVHPWLVKVQQAPGATEVAQHTCSHVEPQLLALQHMPHRPRWCPWANPQRRKPRLNQIRKWQHTAHPGDARTAVTLVGRPRGWW